MSKHHSTKVEASKSSSTRGALFVGLGIFLSRIAGLIRERVFAHYFGNSEVADAFKAALKIPNFLQNLFGEGVLSASFIPVYSRLIGENRQGEARAVAKSIGLLLAVIVSIMALLGVWLTPSMIEVIAPGFTGERRELTITIVRILFPGTAILVMSAWCLGILNSHRRFFLSYAAPVLWNAAIIAALLMFGEKQDASSLAVTAAWGLVIGSCLQFAVQLPTVWRLLKRLKTGSTSEPEPMHESESSIAINKSQPHVRKILGSFGTVVISRGVVQISAYIDNIFASLLPAGAVAALAYAQTIYLLPISLFGMSVTAASLPEMSRTTGEGPVFNAQLREQLNRGLGHIAFFILPSAVVFFLLGDVVVAALFQTGQFGHSEVIYVWMILAGSGLGLLASTFGRLYASTHYALQDTRSPLKFALIRVALTTCFGWYGALHLPALLGLQPTWGTVALTVMSGIAGWVEYILLKRNLDARIGSTGLSFHMIGRIWIAALIAAASGYGVKLLLQNFSIITQPPLVACGVFLVYGAVYLGVAHLAGLPIASQVLHRGTAVVRRFVR